jgi:hypothetical protein
MTQLVYNPRSHCDRDSCTHLLSTTPQENSSPCPLLLLLVPLTCYCPSSHAQAATAMPNGPTSCYCHGNSWKASWNELLLLMAADTLNGCMHLFTFGVYCQGIWCTAWIGPGGVIGVAGRTYPAAQGMQDSYISPMAPQENPHLSDDSGMDLASPWLELHSIGKP